MLDGKRSDVVKANTPDYLVENTPEVSDAWSPQTESLPTETNASPHLTYWLRVAEERDDIAATALRNHNRVQELDAKVKTGAATIAEAIELGYSYGAGNDMAEGACDLYDLFVYVAASDKCNQIACPDIYTETDPQHASYRLLSEHVVESFETKPELFEAAQFLQEASEVRDEHVCPRTQELLRWGAIDIYERIIGDPANEWKHEYQRRALLHWHGLLTDQIASDLANPRLDSCQRTELLGYFREVQIEFLETINDLESRTLYRGKEDQQPHEVPLMRNGELNEFFAQARGWFLIYARDDFGRLSIMPAFERLDRPSDNITRNARKFSHDSRYIDLANGEEVMVQLKACPKSQPWESAYDSRVKVVRIKHMDPDEFRKKCRKSLRRIKTEYRSHKPRQYRALIRDMQDFYQDEL